MFGGGGGVDGDGLLAGAGEAEHTGDGDDGVFACLGEECYAVVALAVLAAEFLDHLGIVALVVSEGLAGAFGTTQFAAVADVLVAARLEAIADVVGFHFGHCAEDGDEHRQERVRLAVGEEDRHLFLLEVDIHAGLLAGVNVVEHVGGVAAQARQLADQQGVDTLGNAVEEALVEHGSVGAFLAAAGLLGVSADELEPVVAGVGGEVVHLTGGVLSVAGGADAGVDYGCFHIFENVLMS